MAAARRLSALPHVLLPRGAGDQQRRSIDGQSPCRRAWSWVTALSASVPLPSLRGGGEGERLVERAPRKAQRRGADRHPEQVQRLHRDAGSPRPASPISSAADAVELEPGERVGGDHLDPLGDRQAGIVAADDEGAEMPRAPSPSPVRAKTRQHIGDGAVGDVGFLAVEDPAVAVRSARSWRYWRRRCRSPARSGRRRRWLRRSRPWAAIRPSARRCPHRLIAPEPRPCMAKAKSARPEWRGERRAGDGEAADVGRRVAVGDAELEEARRRRARATSVRHAASTSSA